MRQYNPPHPGEVLYGLYMEPAGLTITEVAKAFSVDRKTISRIVNGETAITTEMAIKLGLGFNTNPELWLNMQSSYDLWHTRNKIKTKLKKIHPFPQLATA